MLQVTRYMKLLACLGNPGKEYENNRHNAGFMFADYVVNKYQISNINYHYDKYLHSEISEIPIDNKSVFLIKPQTFMNASGESLSACIARFSPRISDDLFVIHDDLDIPLGKFKIQKGEGPKLHNGIESIEKHLKTKDFWRVRIGIDNRNSEKRIDGETYVLQDFTAEEKNILTTDIFPKILSRLKPLL